MYMGERMSYYQRRQEAMLMPSMYWSGISDGMQQSHNALPHLGNMTPFPAPLPQHIQGMIMHGRSIEIYRTFHNIQNSSNLSIHCLLLSLEKTIQKEGKIPDVLYYQIDGGPENVAKSVLGIGELIVIRGLSKKVVFTRLPVGHTHEDIDSKFALIWKRVRNNFVLSPIQYAECIVRALNTANTTCSVHDLFVIPDYNAYISPYVDKHIERFIINYLYSCILHLLLL